MITIDSRLRLKSVTIDRLCWYHPAKPSTYLIAGIDNLLLRTMFLDLNRQKRPSEGRCLTNMVNSSSVSGISTKQTLRAKAIKSTLPLQERPRSNEQHLEYPTVETLTPSITLNLALSSSMTYFLFRYEAPTPQNLHSLSLSCPPSSTPPLAPKIQ